MRSPCGVGRQYSRLCAELCEWIQKSLNLIFTYSKHFRLWPQALSHDPYAPGKAYTASPQSSWGYLIPTWGARSWLVIRIWEKTVRSRSNVAPSSSWFPCMKLISCNQIVNTKVKSILTIEPAWQAQSEWCRSSCYSTGDQVCSLLFVGPLIVKHPVSIKYWEKQITLAGSAEYFHEILYIYEKAYWIGSLTCIALSRFLWRWAK